ncbi:MAG: 50S ribosomal protein L10 [Prolixibacteraceae bacterium]|jgi:large subunit ribosomal protein L10|nr:50S ribosomal protein L10 [Prolixibacteraceae bacterium]MBT6005496.1 50S ribosomal protein L10 [Prolixibacteraceae bacterium]MBT6763742.1 50S ribosomal protein L10 [Prolixibacteraceae bacterium]MBT7000650.1 50S ribosomal protein L10 [Prolixibacteraceae bacterium]MBT7397378.1 50S ribosomal protein L10 [Prolixibacteraceae bacterium]
MKSSEKKVIINNLQEQIDSYNHFYLTDISGLNAENTSDLRRLCFKQDVKLVVVKNTLLRKALENSNKDAEEIYGALKGNTSVMFTENANSPAKLIKDFSKKHKKPVLKAAYVEESVYMGEDQLEVLIAVKSKNELIADVVALLQSPMTTLLSQLKSGGNIIHGVLDTLKEKE